ncbi:MAG: purine-nucleoside phosphorylase [Clostridia bacterium]|nr:purine-nucleoside phosphorylase [Clostridia bacterium]
MIMVPTPHNNAKIGDIAKVVIMPGDPLRAKYIAETYLNEYVCYNEVRGMLGYTGYYKDVKVSVQGSGMGVPSMGIYSRELFEGYDVDYIIRVGSAGALANNEASDSANRVKLRDILVAETVDTDSNFLVSNELEELFPVVSYDMLEKLEKIANQNKTQIKVGEIYTSDSFYKSKEQLVETSKLDILGVEMETLALYANAAITSKNALAMFTVSDNPILGESLSASERQTGFNKMIELALALAIECGKE